MFSQNASGVAWRDGVNFAHRLLATKAAIDEAADWQESIYSLWLFTLRALTRQRAQSKEPQRVNRLLPVRRLVDRCLGGQQPVCEVDSIAPRHTARILREHCTRFSEKRKATARLAH